MYQRLFLRSPDKNRVVVLVVHHQFSELALETKHTLGPQIPCSTFDCLTYSCDQSIAAAAAATVVFSLCRMVLFLSPVSTARDTRNWKLWSNHLASFPEKIIYEYAANPLCLTAKNPALGRQSVSCKHTHQNSTENHMAVFGLGWKNFYGIFLSI